ncbi:transmembrane glycoprotein NMB [Protopterus annectens]|uniref:transmembrane glycoprotein NMB n=1 Tax=Protopterus annectens TaxID=7888 RepID=UPI001CFA2120|nr:transmembrane glycoprotein NMB [Protopterus annectens]
MQPLKQLVFGALLVLTLLVIESSSKAHKRFSDVSPRGDSYNTRNYGRPFHGGNNRRYHARLQDWSPDTNNWIEKMYPVWKARDARWKTCWKGGRVMVHLTSDSPALVGSNITFVASLQFPRCQKEDENGNIVYNGACSGDSGQSGNVYNSTSWTEDDNEDYDRGDITCNSFPDGRPFPHHSDHRHRQFVYIFFTNGQYYQKSGRSFTTITMNTTNMTLGNQEMDVVVYHRRGKKCVPIANASTLYTITDQIPFTVNISQKNNRNASQHRFIRDMPILFAVHLHDPSNYLKDANISYRWNFSDGTGLFVSGSSLANHTYTELGNFSAMLTIEAVLPIPAPCGPVTPTPPITTEKTTILPTTRIPATTNTSVTTKAGSSSEESSRESSESGEGDLEEKEAPAECLLHRYGYFNTVLTVVDGILDIDVLPMTRIGGVTSAQSDSVVEFVVTCEGSIPTEVCTVILDSSCKELQSEACDSIPVMDQCRVTVQRTFDQPGIYCVNVSLLDEASLALTSTMVSVGEGTPRAATLEIVLIFGAFLLLLVFLGVLFLQRRFKTYTPVDGNVQRSERFNEGTNVYFNRVKASLFSRTEEKNPLLKDKAGVI